MTQHTPAPWTCKPSNKSDAEYAIFNEDDNYLTTDEYEHEANARLIAAAPELLDLLNCILMQHRTDGAYSSRGEVRLSKAMEFHIEAAIAKAKGV